MKEQKATLIPIVQQIRLNSQNELVKRTTKEDSTTRRMVKLKIRRAASHETFSYRTFLISSLAWKTMDDSI